MAQPVFSGARAKLIVDGQEIGFATGVSASESITHQRVDVLGNIDSQELVPVSRVVSANADFVRITNTSIQELGIMPRGEHRGRDQLLRAHARDLRPSKRRPLCGVSRALDVSLARGKSRAGASSQ